MKFYKLLALLSVGVAGAFPTACTDKYEDMGKPHAIVAEQQHIRLSFRPWGLYVLYPPD